MYDGMLNIYKEPGYTSFDVVAKLRGILRQRKIGHAGTLDPSAEGVLPVCLGTGTRIVELLSGETKTYEAVLLLGLSTDTQDTDGTVLQTRPVACTEEQIRREADAFLGEQMQIPPMYSALKKNGKKLYELARAGVEVEREPRPVTFYEIQVLSVRLPRVQIRITCSRGTYIRTFCSDLGDRLGCGGCMEHLLRTRVGPFALEEARKLEEIQKLAQEGRIGEAVLPVDRMFAGLPAVFCDPEADRLAHNGNSIPEELLRSRETVPEEDTTEDDTKKEIGGEIPALSSLCDSAAAGEVRLYDSQGAFIGLFQRQAENIYRVRKMFYRPDSGCL